MDKIFYKKAISYVHLKIVRKMTKNDKNLKTYVDLEKIAHFFIVFRDFQMHVNGFEYWKIFTSIV